MSTYKSFYNCQILTLILVLRKELSIIVQMDFIKMYFHLTKNKMAIENFNQNELVFSELVYGK